MVMETSSLVLTTTLLELFAQLPTAQEDNITILTIKLDVMLLLLPVLAQILTLFFLILTILQDVLLLQSSVTLVTILVASTVLEMLPFKLDAVELPLPLFPIKMYNVLVTKLLDKTTPMEHVFQTVVDIIVPLPALLLQ